MASFVSQELRDISGLMETLEEINGSNRCVFLRDATVVSESGTVVGTIMFDTDAYLFEPKA